MKNIKAPKIVTIGILTLITIVFWVGFEIYRTFTQKPEAPVAENIITPLNPTLDQTVLSKIQERMYLDEGQIGQTVITAATPTPLPTIAPTVAPTASASAQPSTSPVESPLPEATP